MRATAGSPAPGAVFAGRAQTPSNNAQARKARRRFEIRAIFTTISQHLELLTANERAKTTLSLVVSSRPITILIDANCGYAQRYVIACAGAHVTQDIDIKALIRTVPNFPRPGVLFRDITTLLKHAGGFSAVVEKLAAAYRERPIDKVAAIESRGFIVGAALAYKLNVGFVPIRKSGKLPAENFGHDYELEYGADRLEMHRDGIERGERVLLVD